MSLLSNSDTGETPFKCDLCGKGFIQKVALQYHMTSVHADEDQTHQCKMCGKTVYGNTELRKHMAMHHDARRFACALCAETFATQSNLEAHKELNHKNEILAEFQNEATMTTPSRPSARPTDKRHWFLFYVIVKLD